MRRLIAFPCDGETLVGALDEADGDSALLIVAGGNEVRGGAHRGMAMLAARVAAAGHPVLRFDRRGVGDSTGENRGFRSSAADIAAAAAVLRAETGATRVVAFGNCDAASALALFGRAARLDALVLANPWLADRTGDLPPPAAIRARYAERLRSPAEWRRLLTGGVSLAKLARGLRAAAAPPAGDSDILSAIAGWGDDATVVLAERDATALAFADAARRAHLGAATVGIDTASHSFAGMGETLAEVVLRRLGDR